MIRTVIVLGIIVILSACTAAPSPSSTEMPTEESTVALEPSPEATIEDSPEARGAALFVETRGGFTCATCHYISEGRLVGPGLANITERFESYGLEGTIEEYLRLSIVNPAVYIAPAEPAYPANIMPLTYSALLSEEEINDLIAYILSI